MQRRKTAADGRFQELLFGQRLASQAPVGRIEDQAAPLPLHDPDAVGQIRIGHADHLAALERLVEGARRARLGRPAAVVIDMICNMVRRQHRFLDTAMVRGVLEERIDVQREAVEFRIASQGKPVVACDELKVAAGIGVKRGNLRLERALFVQVDVLQHAALGIPRGEAFIHPQDVGLAELEQIRAAF